MPFDTHDLLTAAGFQAGDGVASIGSTSNAVNSTTSSTYGNYSGVDTPTIFTFETLFGLDTDVEVILWASIDPSTDQIDIRLQNVQPDGETAAEQTGITGGVQLVEVGPAIYQPTTTASPTRYIPQFRNGDGATSVEIRHLTYLFRAQL